jgi:hypothetical protein
VLAAVSALLVAGSSRSVHAQEGHPLAGTWHGTWGPDATTRHDVTLVLDYDGKAITGMMNPGPDAIHFDRITLDPATWGVHFEARSGGAASAPIVIDAKIEDVTSRHRRIVGTWTQGPMKGDFKVSRDD